MDFVYSQSPWVLPKDPEGTEKIFSDHGWKVTFNDHEVIPFGLEKRVYFIRKGLFATLAGGAGDFSRMVGLFPAGTTLGAIRAISQPGNEMPLMAKALLPVEALALDIPLYLRELEKDPAFLSHQNKFHSERRGSGRRTADERSPHCSKTPRADNSVSLQSG